MIKKISLSLIAIATLGSQNLSASDLNPIFQFGYDFGGNTLAEVEHYDYYTGYVVNKIRAGQGVSFEGGASITSDSNDLELKFLVGYKFDQESSFNGSVTWEQVPLTAVAMIKKNRWKFGGGITYHITPRLSGGFSGYDQNNIYFNDSVDDSYEDTLGTVLEAQYNFTDSAAIGIKGTLIEYKLKNDPSVIANGNSVGINFTYTFGKESVYR
ncbi:MAG TPA: hypothetical protein ENK82_05010 [Campylobacterales bacterium]|nr:hypothetical protein [Campylobacterales bacterium]